MTESKESAIVTGATNAGVLAKMDQAIALASAGVMNMTPRDESGNTTLYGEFRVTNDNAFEKYSQLSVVSPHVFIPLIKLGLGTVSGITLEASVDEAGASEDLLSKMKEWGKEIDLFNKIQNITRCTIRDGTTIISLGREAITEEDRDQPINLPLGSITAINVLPMQYMTLLTPAEDRATTNSTYLIKGCPDRAIMFEEKKKAESGMVIFGHGEFALFRLFNEGYFMDDILGRKTYGIYGASLLEPIDRSIKGLLDLNEGFSAYMRRYGIDRLNVNLPIVEELRREERYEEADKILDDAIASMQRLGAHEDMVSGGAEVSTISNGTVPSVKEMKQAFEGDIQVGLLQSPLTMGQASGTTYASGFLVEADRMTILEAIQMIILNTVQEEIINPQLRSFGATPNTILVKAADLTTPIVTAEVIADARLSGDVTQEEFREAIGLVAEKPESTEMDGAESEEMAALRKKITDLELVISTQEKAELN